MQAKALWFCIGLGAALRLIPLSAPMPMEDGVIRLYTSTEWAQHPEWFGLGGQWPPLVMYLQGLFIRAGADPIWTAHLMNYFASVATLYLAYLLTLQMFNDPRAAIAATFLAATYWLHASLVSMNSIETFYTPLLLYSLYLIVKAIQTKQASTALAVGIALSIAGLILMRHEGRLAFVVLMGYLLARQQWQLALWLGLVNGLLLVYLLYENWTLRGHWMADLMSAQVNFEFAASLKAQDKGWLEGLHGLRRVFTYMPSIFFLVLAFIGVYRSYTRREAHPVLLTVAASLGLLIYSALFSPLIPFPRYFVPVFMPLMSFAGLGWRVLANRNFLLAAALAGATVLTQIGYWGYGRARFEGGYHWSIWLPYRPQNSQQQTLEQQLEQVPPHATVYVINSPRALWHVRAGILNTRRFDLMPALRQEAYYDQYRARPTEPLEISRRNLVHADYLFVHPRSRRFAQIKEALPAHQTVYQSDFLIVYRVVKER